MGLEHQKHSLSDINHHAHWESAADARDHLHHEAMSENHPHKQKQLEERRPLLLDEDGKYQVQNGDTLLSVAERSLRQQGKAAIDKGAIADEALRIANLNFKEYPQIWTLPSTIDSAMNLRIKPEEKPLPAVIDCGSSNPYEPTSGLKIAQGCDRVLALEGAHVVLHAGSKAIVNKGAIAFAFEGSTAEVHPGGRVIAAGGTVIAWEGARVRSLGPAQSNIISPGDAK